MSAGDGNPAVLPANVLRAEILEIYWYVLPGTGEVDCTHAPVTVSTD